jgi:hypothetical protein
MVSTFLVEAMGPPSKHQERRASEVKFYGEGKDLGPERYKKIKGTKKDIWLPPRTCSSWE